MTDFKLSTDLSCDSRNKNYPTKHSCEAIFFDKLALSNTLNFEKDKSLDNETKMVLKMCKGFSFGLFLTADGSKQTITNHELSLFFEPRDKFDAILQFHHDEPTREAILNLYHKPRNGLKVAQTWKLDLAHFGVEHAIGIKHKFDDGFTWRAKGDNLGQLDLIGKIKFSEQIKAELSSGFNIKEAARNGKDTTYFGVSFDLAF